MVEYLSKDKELPNKVHITKEQFDKAMNGELVGIGAIKDFEQNNFAVVVIGKDDLPLEERKKKFRGVIECGDDVYYIPVGEYSLEQLINPYLDKIPVVYFGNVAFLLTTDEAWKEINKEGLSEDV